MTFASVLRTTVVRMAPAALAILVGRYIAQDRGLADFVTHPLHLALITYLAGALLLLVRADRKRRAAGD